MWEFVAPQLNGYQVINVDFRGHRYSTAFAPYQMEHLAEDCLAIMDREGVERVVHCGLSMGGMTGMRLALRHPSRVSALVLMDSNDEIEVLSRRLQYTALASVYKFIGFNKLLERQVLPLMFGKSTMSTNSALVSEFTLRVRDHNAEHLANAIRAVVARNSISHRLSEIHCPTLVMVGQEDLATPAAYSQRIHKGIKGSQFIEIPRAGHLSAYEQGDIVSEILQDFLAELDVN